ncbi:hydrolase [Bombiscardovia nodaiensis]|uniref:Hydrolase n=1 Tax=Bombiscardovia nodaiensis TaxID=2932181 RepID=A0ABN6S8L9_9BIFI|nr:hydrolase [Bombiscardovia nodaiensis]
MSNSIQAPIEAVIFDLGGVISRWVPEDALCSRYRPETIQQFFRDCNFFALNDDLDAGMSWQEAYERIAASSDEGHRELYLQMMHWYHDHFAQTQAGDIPGAVQMVRDLQAAGVGVYALTNWNGDTFHYGLDAMPILQEFNGILVSGDCGIRKPDIRIYQLAIERFALTPERSLFVDDKQVNAEGARAAGLQALEFTGMAALRQQLITVGLPLPALQ